MADLAHESGMEDAMSISGKDILDLGFPPGPHIPAMIERARQMPEANAETLRAALAPLAPAPAIPLKPPGDFALLAEATNADEAANLAAVSETMAALTRTPVVRAAAALPDACPAGPVGTIPVGGVAVSEAIHPGMHSADICCSVAISIYPDLAPAQVMDRVHAATHFGPGGSDKIAMPAALGAQIAANPLTKPHLTTADHHFGTQGDGNHFAFVGRLASDGRTALVTHHGSRGFGARLYKAGMKLAEEERRKRSPETLRQNAWITADSPQGETYWDALQIVRAWTKASHFALHDAVGRATDRFWNEHNFVFRKTDGLFYHAKGATPAYPGWAADATELTLIPLNMAQPVLIARGRNNSDALGFSPHGAGRNFSRSEHKRRGLGDVAAETAGLDARFYCGIPDATELPSGYKNAAELRRQIDHFGLAEIVDEVLPYGAIMAGDWERDAPWRQKRAKP
ncbi:MAG: RtcB family protein [Pseudomonadota bacterium]